MKFDGRNRVIEAHSSSGSYHYGYSESGRIVQAAAQTRGGSSVERFEHDGQGRLTSAYSGAGDLTAVDYSGGSARISGAEGEFAFGILPSGRIAEVRSGGLDISAEYDPFGSLAAFRSDRSAVHFERDGLGRVAEMHSSGGKASRYEYDALGNRSSVDLGSGGAVAYKHDPSGNIVEVLVSSPGGARHRQEVRIGEMNRVESILYEGSGTLAIGYDSMGRAVKFEIGAETVTVEYEGPGPHRPDSVGAHRRGMAAWGRRSGRKQGGGNGGSAARAAPSRFLWTLAPGPTASCGSMKLALR